MKRKKPRHKKEIKVESNLKKVVEQFFAGKGFQPITLSELMGRLALPPQYRPILKKILKELISSESIRKDGNQYAAKIDTALIIKGPLSVHPRGFGFLRPEAGSGFDQDIFVPKHLTQHAVDGDIVEVKVAQETVSAKGPEGRVVSILERARSHIAGIVRYTDSQGKVIAYVPLLGDRQSVIVKNRENFPLTVGDRIIMEVLDWGSKEKETVCRFSHHLGHISDPSCDIEAAIEEFELPSDFPLNVIKQAKAYGTKVKQQEIKNRVDLRDKVCITIDPETAKDFDDALTVEKKRGGGFHLRVHIADVSHYVHENSPLDEEARHRCNSTYFPGYCLPMLPPSLSENLCSLKPNVNRLAVSVLIEINQMGEVTKYKIVRSIIKSAKRFTYNEAKEVLDGKKASTHKKMLEEMVELCHLLKKKRYERGSIEFALPELIIVVDDQGAPQETVSSSYDITHQMVEEFMLKANELVATHLAKEGKEFPYRVHDEPSSESLKDFVSVAGALGYKLPDEPEAEDLQKLFEEALETPHGPYLSTCYIRSMQMAVYSTENLGHYGLSLSHYCHFTSPIRRYVDLVIHRLLFEEEPKPGTMAKIASQCSEQERISSRAETRVKLLKKLRYLDQLVDKNPHATFEAVITRVLPFGLYFELEELMLEGFAHVSELAQDYFVFDEKKHQLKGRRSSLIYRPGTKVDVFIKDIDLTFLKVEWELIDSNNKGNRRKK